MKETRLLALTETWQGKSDWDVELEDHQRPQTNREGLSFYINQKCQTSHCSGDDVNH